MARDPWWFTDRTSNMASRDHDVAGDLVRWTRVAVNFRQHEWWRFPARIIWFLGSYTRGLENYLGLDRTNQGKTRHSIVTQDCRRVALQGLLLSTNV